MTAAPIYSNIIPGITPNAGRMSSTSRPLPPPDEAAARAVAYAQRASAQPTRWRADQRELYRRGVSINESGVGNTLNATLENPGTISPNPDQGRSNLESEANLQTQTASGTAPPISFGGFVTINAGGNVSGVTTINEFYSNTGIAVGSAAQPLQSELSNIGFNTIQDVTTAGLVPATMILDFAPLPRYPGGMADILNIALKGPATLSGSSALTILVVGPDSGTNGYETFAINAAGDNTLFAHRRSQPASLTHNPIRRRRSPLQASRKRHALYGCKHELEQPHDHRRLRIDG